MTYFRRRSAEDEPSERMLELIAHKPRLVYDGVCNLCIGAVRFLNAIDHKHAIEYTPYQRLTPEITRRYGLSEADLQGRMHMIWQNGSLVRGAAAICEVCKLLAPVTVVCGFFNTPMARRLYDFIARRRYRLFGCSDSCYVPVSTSRRMIKTPLELG